MNDTHRKRKKEEEVVKLAKKNTHSEVCIIYIYMRTSAFGTLLNFLHENFGDN